MKCPFLEEVVVAYCSACSVKKMIPEDSLVDQNPCKGNYKECPLFAELVKNKNKPEEKMTQNIEKKIKQNGEEKPCIWMKAGVVSYRMCTSNYDCKNCDFDQAIANESGTYVESPMVVQAIKKLRQMPASEKKCRYMLTGDFSYKICSNNYECWHCEVDQYIQDTIEASPMLKKRRERLAKQEKKVKGFAMRKDLYYLPNHLWIKVEDNYAKVGIDDFATRIIGKIEKLEFSQKSSAQKGKGSFRLGSLNRMVDLHLPAGTEIIERNESLKVDPSVIRTDPYNKGWLLKIKMPPIDKEMIKGDNVTKWLEDEFDKLHKTFEDKVGVTITDGGELIDDIHGRISDDDWQRLVSRFLQ